MRGASLLGGGVRRLVAVAVAVAGLVLLAGGCGGDDSAGVARADDVVQTTTSGTGTSTVSQADREEALLKFAQCMREQGVDFPDPQPDANGNLRLQPGAVGTGDRAELQKAMEACRQYRDAARPQLTDEQQQERQDQLLEFAKCMREEGVKDFPDPSGEGGFGGFRDAIDPNDPATQKALQACADKVGGFGPPGGGAPPVGGTPPAGGNQ